MVTSASQRVARHRMTCCRLPLPALMVGANEVSHGKPDAEPYRLGAKLLGTVAGDCLEFEDTPAGIHSARVAGCSVIQVGGAPQPGARIRDWRQIRFVRLEGGEILLQLKPFALKTAQQADSVRQWHRPGVARRSGGI